MDLFLDSPGGLVDCCPLERVEGYGLASPRAHLQVGCLGDAWAQEVPARGSAPGRISQELDFPVLFLSPLA